MGAAISNQAANQIIDNSFSIANSVIQNCVTTAALTVNVDAKDHCTQNINDPVQVSSNTVINTSCAQNATVVNNMKAQIATQIINQSNAAAQSLGGPSLSYSNQLEDFAQSTASLITTVFTSTCANNNAVTVNITCENEATQTINGVDVSSSTSSYINCTQNADIKTNSKIDLSTRLQSTSGAMEANSLGAVIIVVLIFLAIFGIFFVRSLNGPMGWLVVVIVAAVIIGVGVYAFLAFSHGWYPFSGST